jgi:hypothetical protein
MARGLRIFGVLRSRAHHRSGIEMGPHRSSRPGKPEPGRVWRDVEGDGGLGRGEPVVGDQLENFTLRSSETGERLLEEGSLSRSVDGRGHFLVLGGGEGRERIARLDFKSSVSGVLAPLLGEKTARDAEEPGEGGIGLGDISVRCL